VGTVLREPVAALDCGTNSTRLLITGDGGDDVRLMRITRLGKGVDSTGALDAESVSRTLAVLAEYRGLMDERRVGRARLVATSAVRDAENGAAFLAAASSVVGVDAELLDGAAEGALAFVGATAALDVAPDAVVVIDIGGGSTELVAGTPEPSAISLDLGCVRLTERFLHHDPPQEAELTEAAAFVDRELARAQATVPELAEAGRTLVGLAGTVSTLGALVQGLTHYDRERIHHSVLTAAAVASWCDRLAAEPAVARARRPAIAPGREDVIVGGVVVLKETMARFSFDHCVVSEADLLDGIAASIAN